MDCASTGKLYIVATPIGNLKDITLRALEVLKKVDVVLSEDTRETDKLFKHFGIKKPQIPYTDQKHNKTIDYIMETLNSGKDIALVSDSGTPLISDPGFQLVRGLRIKGIEVVSIPGPSSLISALSVSGLPTDNFTFIGFLPKGDIKRRNLIKKYAQLDVSLIIFESPNRVNKLMGQIHKALGNRAVCVIKDLTKKFENVQTGYVEDILKDKLMEKGEYIVIVAKKGYKING